MIRSKKIPGIDLHRQRTGIKTEKAKATDGTTCGDLDKHTEKTMKRDIMTHPTSPHCALGRFRSYGSEDRRCRRLTTPGLHQPCTAPTYAACTCPLAWAAKRKKNEDAAASGNTHAKLTTCRTG